MHIDEKIQELKNYFDSYQGPFIDFRGNTVVLDGAFSLDDLKKVIAIMVAMKGVSHYKDGDPCNHPGCLNHVEHPCEKCGRTQARGEYTSSKAKWVVY